MGVYDILVISRFFLCPKSATDFIVFLHQRTSRYPSPTMANNRLLTLQIFFSGNFPNIIRTSRIVWYDWNFTYTRLNIFFQKSLESDWWQIQTIIHNFVVFFFLNIHSGDDSRSNTKQRWYFLLLLLTSTCIVYSQAFFYSFIFFMLNYLPLKI